MVIDLIGTAANDNYVLVVEAKRSNLVETMKQCLLAMYDMWKINDRGVLYGFVTTGEDWRMLTYDGREFAVTRKFSILFDGFQENKRVMDEGLLRSDWLHVCRIKKWRYCG